MHYVYRTFICVYSWIQTWLQHTSTTFCASNAAAIAGATSCEYELDVDVCRRHDTHDWIMSRIEWVVTHRANEPCHTYEWVISHIRMSPATHTNESSHMWLRHVSRMNESCRMYEWVMSHIWMSYVAYTNESCHIHEWVMSHMYEWVMSHV